MMIAMMATGLDQVTAFSAVAATLNNLGPGLGDVTSGFMSLSDAAKWISVARNVARPTRDLHLASLDNANLLASVVLDRISEQLGKATAWLTLLMVLVTFVVVVMRYVFDAGLIWLQESVVWMHAFVFTMGAAYTLQQEEHVRVDIFYRGMNECSPRLGGPPIGVLVVPDATVCVSRLEGLRFCGHFLGAQGSVT